jgi:hypothetical protein
VFRSRPVSLALVGLFLWVTGCHSYRQVEIAELPEQGTFRVTSADGNRQVVYDPWVAKDSLHAWQYPAGNLGPTESDKAYYLVSLDAIDAIERRVVSSGKTVALVAVFLVVAGAAVGYAALASSLDDCC